MKKVFLVLVGALMALQFSSNAGAFVVVDVYRDGYIEDFTRDQNVPPDGIPDRLSDTNALLASRGEFFDQFNAFNVDSHVIMTFDISSYWGMNLSSAFLTGYGTRVDNKGSLDPVSGQFYIYSGDGQVSLSDFNTPADSLGTLSFQSHAPNFDLDPFQLDVKNALQTLLGSSQSFAEFRVESEFPTVFINAGEVDPATFFSVDSRWPGPKLVLSFDHDAVVPEPASALLLAGSFVGSLLMRRRKAKDC